MRVRHTKRDSNHTEVIAGCRAAGLNVWDVADLGGRVLDILVAGYNVNIHGYEMVMVEIKPNKEAPFTEDETRILEENPDTTMIAYSAEDVLRRFGRYRNGQTRRDEKPDGNAVDGFTFENIGRKAVASCKSS